jgi:hypothetical protein
LVQGAFDRHLCPLLLVAQACVGSGRLFTADETGTWDDQV